MCDCCLLTDLYVWNFAYELNTWLFSASWNFPLFVSRVVVIQWQFYVRTDKMDDTEDLTIFSMMEFMCQVMKKYATSRRSREIKTIHDKCSRYHLQDYRKKGRPCGAKEIFNHAYSSLRNIIDICFNVLKLFSYTEENYSLQTQVLIVFVAVTLHNYNWQKAQRDMLFKKCNNVWLNGYRWWGQRRRNTG